MPTLFLKIQLYYIPTKKIVKQKFVDKIKLIKIYFN